ncbi:MAG: FIST C-terminal domain-containing protein [Methanophagales archaeon]|nr:FIST C-terminal domain-containing protein [Methanophagales archaeon]
MATKLATGIAKGEDSEKVAKEALSQAKAKLDGDQIDLAMVYCSSKYDYKKVVNAVRATTNKAPLIGCSTAGEFTEDKVERESIAVGLIASDEIKFFTAIAEGVREDPELVARSLANKLQGIVEGYPNLTAILLVDGLAGVGEEMAVLASHVFEQAFVEKVRFVGGTAGDDMQLKETFVFSGDIVATNSACICLLASKMPLFTAVKHGHTPLSGHLKITRAEGNKLYEVDGRPAWEVWKEETAEAARKRGVDIEELKTPAEFAQFFSNYMLGLATGKEGEYKIRWPVSINEDGSLNFTCGIAEGSTFRIMDGSNIEDQINAVEEAVRIAKQSAESAGYTDFAGIFVFECAVRQLMLGDRFSECVDRFKKVLPGVPILGWESYGEIRLEPGQFSGFHNTTSVIMLLPNGAG